MLGSQKAEIAVQHGLALFVLFLIPLAYQFGLETLETKLTAWQGLGAAALLTPIAILLSQVVDRNKKFHLVYLKRDQAAPGFRVQKLCQEDGRYLYRTLQDRWPEVFDDHVKRSDLNALWYTHIYSGVRDLPAVATANKRFMLARDVYCSGLVALLAMGIWLIGELSVFPECLSPIAVLIFFVEVVVVHFIARGAGEDLVKTSVSEALHAKDNVPA